jgi:hypothetical protein
MIRDLVWLLSITLITAGIALMHIPTALIFVGICCAVIAYFGRK